MNSELLKLLHLIFLTVSSIIGEFHSPVQSISENIAIFFNLLNLIKMKKRLMRSLFIALFPLYIVFHNTEFPSWNLLNLKRCNGICFEDSLALKKRLLRTYSFRFLTYFRQQAMVLSSEDKAIVKNDYEEKGWTAYQICQEHESKKLGNKFCSTSFEAI